MASFAEPDSPFNKVVGLGFDGVPSAAELDVVEKAFADRGAPTQVELAHLAEPAIGELLSDRGYRLESFENVLGLALDGDPERSRHPASRSAAAPTTSSKPGSRSSPTPARTPTPRACPGTTSSPARPSRTPSATSPPRAAPATPPSATASSRAAPTSASPTASPSSPAPPPRLRTAATASRARWSPPDSPTPGPPDATSRSSSPSRVPSRSRTRNAAASTCSTPARRW